MRRVSILAGLLAVLSTQAHGADIYAGAGLGGSISLSADGNVNDARSILATVGTAGRITYDKATVTPAVLLGVGLNRYIAAEIRYAYLGDYGLKTSAGGGTAKESDDVHAFSLTAVGKYPLGPKVQVLAKVGFADTIVNMTCSIPGQGCASATDSSVGFVFGAGISLLPARVLELRFDYTQYNGVGNSGRNYTAGTFGALETLAIYHF